MSDLRVDGFSINPVRPMTGPDAASALGKAAPTGGKDFKSFLLESLEKVNKLQDDATQGVQKLVTGETNNVAEVLAASKKAGVAFDLLMEIRNKLMDAYSEIKQMRV
jgi:flagellar hook-basal body complex protein FliE